MFYAMVLGVLDARCWPKLVGGCLRIDEVAVNVLTGVVGLTHSLLEVASGVGSVVPTWGEVSLSGDAHTYAGSYRLLRQIGRGATAEVFEARSHGSRGFERRVVVKRLHEHLCGNPQAEKRFVEEAHLGAQLEHDNIVGVLDLGVAEGRLYMVLEHVHGMDLKSLLAHVHVLPPTVALHVAREVARGLHHAHTISDPSGVPLSVVHRDVSPSNILVSSIGQVKLTDFGVAKAEGREKTRAGIVKGKYAYMSPEQVRQDAVDARSDVFSLATVLAETLTGERVFAGRGPLEIMDAVLDALPPVLPRHVTAAIPRASKLIERCFRPRDRRLASCRALYVELAGMLIAAGAAAPELHLCELVQDGMAGELLVPESANSTSITIHRLRAEAEDESEQSVTHHYRSARSASDETIGEGL